MKRLLPLVLLLAAGCLKQGSSYSPAKVQNNLLLGANMVGYVGKDFHGSLSYYFEAADHSRGQRHGKVTVIDPLPAGLKQEYLPYSENTVIKGIPREKGTWTLKVEIVDTPTGRKAEDKCTITIK
jgi:hypothetical protein